MWHGLHLGCYGTNRLTFRGILVCTALTCRREHTGMVPLVQGLAGRWCLDRSVHLRV